MQTPPLSLREKLPQDAAKWIKVEKAEKSSGTIHSTSRRIEAFRPGKVRVFAPGCSPKDCLSPFPDPDLRGSWRYHSRLTKAGFSGIARNS
jgi:hypothetical protein